MKAIYKIQFLFNGGITMQDLLSMWCKHYNIEYSYDVYTTINSFRKYIYDNDNLIYRAKQISYLDTQLENIPFKELNNFFNIILDKLDKQNDYFK